MRTSSLILAVLTANTCLGDHPSWIFEPSTFSHDPLTGARVAQYERTPPVEPLPDQRLVTSRYRRTRTPLRGLNGSVDTEYQVQSWANGQGGIDAEWERFHDAWRQSFLSGSVYQFGAHSPGFGYGSVPVYGGQQFPAGVVWPGISPQVIQPQIIQPGVGGFGPHVPWQSHTPLQFESE
jgi:hypothetical protein